MAILYGASIAILGYSALSATKAFDRSMALLGATLCAVVAATCVLMLLRDAVVGTINDGGIALKSWGLGSVGWSEIAAFSIETDGAGGGVICIHFCNERAVLSRAAIRHRLGNYLRKLSGFSALVIYPSCVEPPMGALVDQLRRYIPERNARAPN